MSYYPEEQVFQSKEFNDAFKKYLKNKMANGGGVGTEISKMLSKTLLQSMLINK